MAEEKKQRIIIKKAEFLDDRLLTVLYENSEGTFEPGEIGVKFYNHGVKYDIRGLHSFLVGAGYDFLTGECGKFEVLYYPPSFKNEVVERLKAHAEAQKEKKEAWQKQEETEARGRQQARSGLVNTL